ncbi:ATP-binding protein [Streptomyces chartreusis]
MREAQRLLSVSRLVTLSGVGGVGKSRLALHVGKSVRQEFPDGVWLVKLAELRDADLLMQTVAISLRLRNEGVGNAVESFLKDKQLLLVLDNCEHLLEPCKAAVGTLLTAAPRLRILVTSRQALGAEGERILPVPPLSIPDPFQSPPPESAGPYDALRLFGDRAASAVPDFQIDTHNRAAVIGICQRLDGIPLAIELAAVRLRVLSTSQLLDHLDDRFRTLTHGKRAALPHQRTLRAAIDWSFELCSSAERAVWENVSVFLGGFDLQAAEAVCTGNAPQAVSALLAGLVDKSVLIREGEGGRARYRLLETIRRYGWDRLAESGRQTTVRVRHRDYFRRLAEQADADWFSPRQVEWGVRLQREQANMRVALEFCLTEPGQARAGLELAGALCVFWSFIGFLREGQRWTQRALALDPESTAARAKALHGCGWLLTLRGELEVALETIAECHLLAQRLGDASALAYADVWAGSVALYQGDREHASALLAEALECHRANGDLFGVWVSLHQLATGSLSPKGRSPVAIGEEALALCEAYGAGRCKPFSLWALGLARWQQDGPRAAIPLLQEALRLHKLLDDPVGGSHTLSVLAYLMADTGQYEKATRLFAGSEAVRNRYGVSPLTDFGYFAEIYNRYEEQSRRALGDEAFLAAFQKGTEFTFDQAVAYALSKKTSAPAPASQNVPAVLTRRERQVADLLAQGLSDREIAANLVISQRTAETHVQNILVKLGLTSRTHIAEHLSAWRDLPEGPGEM